jgi:hypothetical protein
MLENRRKTGVRVPGKTVSCSPEHPFRVGLRTSRATGGSGKLLDEHQTLVPPRVIVGTADYGKAELLVEAGRLKFVGFKHDLLAPPDLASVSAARMGGFCTLRKRLSLRMLLLSPQEP